MAQRIPLLLGLWSLFLIGTAYLLHPEQQLISDPYTIFSTTRDALIFGDVIDDVLDDFEPTHSLSIAWPSSHESVQLGNDIPVASVAERPTFLFRPLSTAAVFDDSKQNQSYTLILTDPDAKSRAKPKWSEMCHWILTNLTAPTVSSPQTSPKEGELVAYLPPSPPRKTGKHRYVFVLLSGETVTLQAPEDRKHWGYGKVRHGIRDWAAENGQTIIGANYFYAENEKQ